jgi:hypothetical protein
MVGKVLEITFVLIVAYLVLANAHNFSIAAQTVGSVYEGAVKTLQGR